jgi:hypothetical protein
MHLLRLTLQSAATVAVFSLTGVAQSRTAPDVHHADPTVVTCRADDVPCRDWVRFRRATAGPYQSLAIATHPGRATVIISEPSARRPEFLALVEATFGDEINGRSYRQWSTGLDGWLEDLVLDVRVRGASTTSVISGHDLAPWNAPAAIVDRLLFLYAALHGTTDGFWVDNVGAFPERATRISIKEPSAAPADLLDWLTAPDRTWTDLTVSAPPVTFKTMEAAKSPSVYQRSDATLTSFVVPPKSPIAALAEPFRRFAVASDLLLGAYQSKSGATFLVGRARQVPFTSLPPLRFETLASFVRARTTELAQSYERQRIFAGRVMNGPFAGWDWAPILLSRQLDDSEFGTLLNQADQILKSWSQAGDVDYYSFAHPRPVEFPFDDESASEYFNEVLGTTSLVFNWNTQAFSTIHQIDQGELISVDRFGALPILYLPSGNIADGFTGSRAAELRKLVNERQASEKEILSREAAADAREYFAELGDPILMRVVQNVLLYQVAQAFLQGVATTPLPPGTARWETVSQVLREEAATWLRGVAAPGSTRGMSPDAERAVETAIRTSRLTVEQLAEMVATPQVTVARLAGASARYRRLSTRYDEVFKKYQAAAVTYGKAFEAFCAAVGGTITTGTSLSGRGRTCNYTSTRSATAQSLTLENEETALKALRSEVESLDKGLETTAVELDDLNAAYAKAESLSRTLAGQAALTAQLDRILARVRASVAREPDSSIRTPALVLSRNVEDEGAIGGHNITFEPTRIQVAPRIAPVPGRRVPPVATRPTIRALDAPAAGDAAVELKITRPGSLLADVLRRRSNPVEASFSARLTRGAGMCDCDAVVVQNKGEFFVARKLPSPVQLRLSGPTGVIDALRGPPRANNVRFDGFAESPELVDNIIRATQLAYDAAGPETTRLSRLTDLATRLFRRSENPPSGESATLFSFLRGGAAEPEILRVANLAPEAVGPLLKTPVPWRTATVTPGEVKTLASGRRATSTYVSFSTGPRPTTVRRIEIEGLREMGESAISPKLLAATVTKTLAQTPVGTTTAIGDGVLLLRDAIRRQMNPAEINFLILQGAMPVRITEAGTGLTLITTDN